MTSKVSSYVPISEGSAVVWTRVKWGKMTSTVHKVRTVLNNGYIELHGRMEVSNQAYRIFVHANELALAK